jgi:hypothetical protein
MVDVRVEGPAVPGSEQVLTPEAPPADELIDR